MALIPNISAFHNYLQPLLFLSAPETAVLTFTCLQTVTPALRVKWSFPLVRHGQEESSCPKGLPAVILRSGTNSSQEEHMAFPN